VLSEIDPRIDPRLMWPLHYLRERLGFTPVTDSATVLHGDILRIDLARGGTRVHGLGDHVRGDRVRGDPAQAPRPG